MYIGHFFKEQQEGKISQSYYRCSQMKTDVYHTVPSWCFKILWAYIRLYHTFHYALKVQSGKVLWILNIALVSIIICCYVSVRPLEKLERFNQTDAYDIKSTIHYAASVSVKSCVTREELMDVPSVFDLRQASRDSVLTNISTENLSAFSKNRAFIFLQTCCCHMI